jgi:hypothetical protein
VLNHRWVSERATYMTPDGYLMAWDGMQSRYRPAHVLIWEQTHERPVRRGWHVHHKDADKRNNRPENLQELDPATHRRLHAGWLLDEDGRWWKRCSGSCGELKLLDEFYARGNGQTYSYCRCCHTLINRNNETIARQRKRMLRNIAQPEAASVPFSLPLH